MGSVVKEPNGWSILQSTIASLLWLGLHRRATSTSVTLVLTLLPPLALQPTDAALAGACPRTPDTPAAAATAPVTHCPRGVPCMTAALHMTYIAATPWFELTHKCICVYVYPKNFNFRCKMADHSVSNNRV
jgi:hypothetical protein